MHPGFPRTLPPSPAPRGQHAVRATSTIAGIVSRQDRPDPAQMQVLARMTPARKLEIARRLREEALALKEAWLRQQHPDEDDAAIQQRIRAWQLHGSARLD